MVSTGIYSCADTMTRELSVSQDGHLTGSRDNLEMEFLQLLF